MENNGNITLRRRHNTKVVFNCSEDELELSYQSLPDCLGNGEDFILLKEKNEKLSLELQSAHAEIAFLNTENSELKKRCLDYENKIKLYRTVAIGDCSGNKNITPQKLFSPTYRQPKKTNENSVRFRKLIRVASTSPALLDASSPDRVSVGQTDLQIISSPVQSNGEQTLQCEQDENSKQQPTVTLHSAPPVTSGTVTPIDRNKLPQSPCSVTDTISQVQVSNCDVKQRVLILADQVGGGMRHYLQNLLGDNFIVTAWLRPNATVDNVMTSCINMCKNFTKSDFVLILAGSNDNSTLHVQSMLYYNLKQLHHTNVLISKVYNNYRHLNRIELNKLVKRVCNNYNNAYFVSLDTEKNKYLFKFNKIEACRLIHREILRINYKIKFFRHTSNKKSIAMPLHTSNALNYNHSTNLTQAGFTQNDKKYCVNSKDSTTQTDETLEQSTFFRS